MSANIVLRQTADQITINRANPDILLVGVAGPVGPGGAGGILGYYGAFSSLVSQAAASTTEDYPFQFEQTDESNGVSITQGTDGFPSRITFGAAGTYNIQFSAQFQNTDTQEHDVQIWLKKNETNVTGSTGFVSVPRKRAGDNGHTIIAWNYVFTVAANDYYEFFWQTDNLAVSIVTYPAGTTPTTPSTPSLILTVTQVMNTQLGPTGPAGTVAVGTTTTLSYGSPALVSNTGTSTAAVLNFSIPEGPQGTWALAQPINTQTGITYTIVSTDIGKLVTLENVNTVALSVNTGAGLTAGQRVDLLQLGGGQVQVGGTATVLATPTANLRTQYSAASLLCISSNSYVLVGDLAVS